MPALRREAVLLGVGCSFSVLTGASEKSPSPGPTQVHEPGVSGWDPEVSLFEISFERCHWAGQSTHALLRKLKLRKVTCSRCTTGTNRRGIAHTHWFTRASIQIPRLLMECARRKPRESCYFLLLGGNEVQRLRTVPCASPLGLTRVLRDWRGGGQTLGGVTGVARFGATGQQVPDQLFPVPYLAHMPVSHSLKCHY